MIVIRPGERATVLTLMAVAGAMMAGQAIGLAASDSLLLSRLGLRALPQAMMISSFATVLATASYTALLGRWSNTVLMRWLLGGSIASLVGLYLLLPWGGPTLLLALYAYYGVSFMVLGTHLYAVASDSIDALSSKRLIPLLGVGATLGELVGGVLCSYWSVWLKADSLLLVWAACQALALFLLGRQRTAPPARAPRRAPSFAAEMWAGGRYLSRSRLGWGLALMVASMTLSLSVAQYLISAQFVSHYPRAEELAHFLGQFLAWTNLAELFIGALVTPWLIQRLGVGAANLVHPALVLVSLSALAASPALGTAMAAWIARKTLQDCLASPTRSLLFNALPPRFRNRGRALIAGVVSSLAQALAGAGLSLLAGQREVLALGSVALAVAYLAATLLVRREYLNSLIEGLETGRLLWLEVGESAARWSSGRLVELWGSWLKNPELHRQQLEGLIPRLRRRGLRQALELGLRHPDSQVRRAVVPHLIKPGTLGPLLLGEPEAQVRLAGCLALAHAGTLPPDALMLAAADPDPRVRAVASAIGGDPERIRHDLTGEPELGVLTADSLPFVNLDLAEPLSALPAPTRAAVLRRRTRLLAPLPLLRLEQELQHPEADVRLAALGLLGLHQDPLARELVALALDDADAGVREEAVRLLAAAGEPGVRAARSWLSGSASPAALKAALTVLARARSERSRELLLREVNAQVEDARRALAGVRICQHTAALLTLEEVPARGLAFLIAALQDRAERGRALALHILALLEGEERLQGVLRALRNTRRAQQAEALEVLCNLGDRAASQRLVSLLEGELPDIPAADFQPHQVLLTARQSADAWVRLGERVFSGRASAADLVRVERLQALRALPWLANLDLAALQLLLHEAVEERFAAGAAVRAGKLYLVLSGELETGERSWGEEHLFGGVSQVRARTPIRLLSIRREVMEACIRRHPPVALAMLRDLARRVRQAESLKPPA